MSLWSNKDTAAIAGTININNASPTLNGVGTSFANAVTGLKPGSFIVIVGVKYKIKSIASDTVLTLTSNYEGTSLTGGTTTITRHLAPTHLSLADARKAVFVSLDEAILVTNKSKGITGAGWWLFNEKIDSFGKSRYNAECLVAMTTALGVSGDSAATGEDLIASDAESVVTISGQPAAQNTISGGATFSVTAAASSGTLTYQWQRALAGTTRFVNLANGVVSGITSANVTTASLSISGVLSGNASANNGNLYRVVISSTAGAAKVTSNAATLTFGT